MKETLKQARRMGKQGLTETFRETSAQLAQPEQDDRRLQIAMRQWEDWKTYALELEGEVIGYKQILDAQRPWVGLTDEEMYEAVRTLCKADSVARSLFDVSKDEYRAIEAKLKDKNT